ncbi:hypothetical protein F503_08444 [Ophiostoma piceae UAMH 11346]|uniref:Uncharacterized protein n=1 Tax=Ophiostoma piceae (strain UAMH 11346) TaxID=1262450 RepID=S3CHT7_OPHP1|nr:hypothetical protein F503_08444 [Ophiostoma piceae UAMH 11346]
MKFSTLISAVALLGASALASPVAEAEAAAAADGMSIADGASLAAAASYHIVCTGGQHPDSRCTNGEKKDGCRCDSKGTYLCDPSSLHKSGGACAKCGCRKS